MYTNYTEATQHEDERRNLHLHYLQHRNQHSRIEDDDCVRDEALGIRGTLCVDCYCTVSRDDPFVLLQAIEYILVGGYPEEFQDDDGEMPKPKRAETRRGLTEKDWDLLEKLTGKREFKTLRDDEFTIPKLKGRKKVVPERTSTKQSKGKKSGKTKTRRKSAAPPTLQIRAA